MEYQSNLLIKKEVLTCYNLDNCEQNILGVRTTHQTAHIAQFHLYEKFRKDMFLETEKVERFQIGW